MSDTAYGATLDTYERISLVLNSLPAYAEADITVEIPIDDPTVLRLMVRDLPTWRADGGRRCTCLTTGTEWFISASMLADMDTTSLDLVSFDNRNGGPLWRIS